MSPRQAARPAVVCILIFGVVTAAAQPIRRPVAVIELSGTEPNKELARKINIELNNSPDLKPLEQQIAFALYHDIVEEGADTIRAARSKKQQAEDQVGTYNFVAAANTASAGMEVLRTAPPGPMVFALYAELAFIVGAARLGERNPNAAADAFRLAHAVHAGFKPDAIRYVPEVVQAYEAAIKATPPLGKIDVAGTGRAFVDGKEVGTAPAWFDAPAGTHVVWLADTDRLPRAKQVVVVAGRKERIEVDDAKAPLEVKVQRARFALKNAPDSAARASAMQHLASLLEVTDAVLLTSVNNKTVVQVWTEKAPGFSALRERKNEKPIDLLRPLLPPKVIIPPKPPDPPPEKRPVVDTRSWYEKPRYQIGGGTALAIIVGIAIYAFAKWDRFLGTNSEFGQTARPRP